MSIRVLLADDQPIIRQGFRVILESESDMEVVGEAQDGLDAVAQVGRRRPDIVLMDIRMPRMDGLDATREITKEADHPGVIIVTTFDLDEYVYGALRAGAAGFLLKDAPVERVVEAVRQVAVGNALVAPQVTRRLITQFAAAAPARRSDPVLGTLTPRERDVLLAIAHGLSNQDIARRLFLEESTVKSHVGRLLSKLELRSRVQAVIYAYETGLVSPGISRAPRD